MFHLLANHNSLNFFSSPLHKSQESIEEELKESNPEPGKGGKDQNITSFTTINKVVSVELLIQKYNGKYKTHYTKRAYKKI